MDDVRLGKGAKAELVPGKSVVNIGRCPVQYVLHSDSSGAPDEAAAEHAAGERYC